MAAPTRGVFYVQLRLIFESLVSTESAVHGESREPTFGLEGQEKTFKVFSRVSQLICLRFTQRPLAGPNARTTNLQWPFNL